MKRPSKPSKTSKQTSEFHNVADMAVFGKITKNWPKHKVSKSDRLDLDLPHKYSMRKQDYFEKIINIHAPEEIS